MHDDQQAHCASMDIGKRIRIYLRSACEAESVSEAHSADLVSVLAEGECAAFGERLVLALEGIHRELRAMNFRARSGVV